MRLPLIEPLQPRRNNRPAVCRPVELKGALTVASSALLMAGSVPEAIMPPIFPLAIFKWTSLCLQTHFCSGEVNEGSGRGFAPLPCRSLLFLSRSTTINAEPQQVLSVRHCSQSDKHEEAEGYARCLLECVYMHTNIPVFFAPLPKKDYIRTEPFSWLMKKKWMFCYFSCLDAAMWVFRLLQSEAVRMVKILLLFLCLLGQTEVMLILLCNSFPSSLQQRSSSHCFCGYAWETNHC